MTLLTGLSVCHKATYNSDFRIAWLYLDAEKRVAFILTFC